MNIKPLDPIGPREQGVIDRVTKLGGVVNHLPSGKVSIEYRNRGEVHDYDSRDDFIDDFIGEYPGRYGEVTFEDPKWNTNL